MAVSPEHLLDFVALIAAVILGGFALRRAIFVVAALLQPRPSHRTDRELPSVTLVVPARDEAAAIGALLDSLDALAYPAERLFVVLVSDGSSDETGKYFARWSAGRSRALALELSPGRGKFA
ncbi:MAG: hypothetical protein WD428_00835, partial [Gaiellaceae bacterium]